MTRMLPRIARALALGGLLLVAAGASLIAVSDNRGFDWLFAGLVVVGVCVVWTWIGERKRLASILILGAVPVAVAVACETAEMRSEWVLRGELPGYEIAARQCLAANREGPCMAPALASIDQKEAFVERRSFWLNPEHHNVYLVYAPDPAAKEHMKQDRCARPFHGDWYLVRRC